MAPGISMEYWRELIERYLKRFAKMSFFLLSSCANLSADRNIK